MHTLLNFSLKTLQAFDPRRDIHLFCSCFASSAGAEFQDSQLLNWLHCKSSHSAEMETSVLEEEVRWKRVSSRSCWAARPE
ncbi:rCG27042 [Rattus norvegicus]|uniref:RCG27042 n=1 Tax=Rattus norvegicus TaxID=10116 RepID=A6HNV9_RAT|nr:rCG27042 [Rattus norvegicus]